MRLILHAGTGTYFEADDHVYVIDFDNWSDISDMPFDDLSDNERAAIAVRYGQLLGPDIGHANCVSYSPNAIRGEAEYRLNAGAYGDDRDKAVLEWVCAAPDSDLDEIGGLILSLDGIWSDWLDNLWFGMREIYCDKNKEEDV